MSKLIDYAAKADFMVIALEVDGKQYKFNLDQELRIQETKLNTELKQQTRQYAFLCMLRNKVKMQVKQKTRILKQKKDALFIKFKATTDKVTEASKRVDTDLGVMKLQKQIDTFTDIQDILDIAVNAFNQRKDLLQTLSSNIRTENKN